MPEHSKGVALVTGASRGIGRATALALAEAGFDLVLAARTLAPGEQSDDLPRMPDGSALPGSLEETARVARTHGVRVSTRRMDLLERETIDALVETALHDFGRIDVLVNNAIYQGPGLMADFLEGSMEGFEKAVEGNLVAQTHLTRLVLRSMLDRGSGIIINMTSEAGMIDPPLPLERGGWSFAHGATKAGLHRMAGILHLEYGGRGIRAYNLEPGFVTSESCVAAMGELSAIEKLGVRTAPVEVPAAVVRWLCTDGEAAEYSGRNIHAQPFCKQRGLIAGWP